MRAVCLHEQGGIDKLWILGAFTGRWVMAPGR